MYIYVYACGNSFFLFLFCFSKDAEGQYISLSLVHDAIVLLCELCIFIFELHVFVLLCVTCVYHFYLFFFYFLKYRCLCPRCQGVTTIESQESPWDGGGLDSE